MVEQWPATVPGASGDAAGGPPQPGVPAHPMAPRGARSVQPADGPTSPVPQAASRPAPMPPVAGEQGLSAMLAVSQRAWAQIRHVVRARVWPGPWAGDAGGPRGSGVSGFSRTGLASHRLPGKRAARLSVGDLPEAALRSDVWLHAKDATGSSGGRRRRFRPRDPDAYAVWEATGIVGACLLLTGRPGTLVVRQAAPHTPGRAMQKAGRRRRALAWAPGRRRREVRGLRWARGAGFDLLAPSAVAEVDLCLVRLAPDVQRALSSRDLHTLLCDATSGMRPGGLVLATLDLRSGGHRPFGAAELRGLVARLDEAGLTLVGDLDGRMGLIGVAGAPLAVQAGGSPAPDQVESAPRMLAARPPSPESVSAVVRLMLRYRGVLGE